MSAPSAAGLVERVARAIYLAMDPQRDDPWDDAVARGGRHGGIAPPMIREAREYARAALAEVATTLNAEHHAVDLEQCSILVDSAPIQRAMEDAAKSLRALAAIKESPDDGR